MSLVSIADALRQRYGDAHASAWLTQQRTPEPPHQRPYETPLRRPKASMPSAPIKAAPAGPGDLTRRITASVEPDLHLTARRIYRTLHQIAIEVAARRGYSPKVSSVTFHLPTELLAFELGMSRTTLWTHTKALVALGLVDQRGHTTTYKGKRVKDGSLWSVKLHPQRGKRARLSFEDFKFAWRDLEADIEHGRTAYNWIEQSRPESKDLRIDALQSWALAPGRLKAPVDMTVQAATVTGPEAMLDVPWAPRNERNMMVDMAAKAIAHYLGDSSLDFYRLLLWQLLRRRDQGQDYFHTLYTMILRAGADLHDGFARRPGALLVQRLKDSGLWEWIRGTPLTRVGAKPVEV